ncbi:hypothetical protein PHYSODRAFT_339182, partial [Phytophthora sojae]
MVRVPGSRGDSGFHRESVEDAHVKKEPGEEASSDIGSTKTLLNKTRSADRQSARRTSVDGIEGDLETDLEDKPQHPPQVPSGTPVDLGANRDSLTKQTKAGSDRYAFADSPIRLDPDYLGAIADKDQIVRKKLRAPGLDDEHPRPSALDWSEADLDRQYHLKELRDFLRQDPVMVILRPEQIDDPKGPISAPRVTDNKLMAVKNLLGLLKEADFVAGAFEANDLFDQDLDVIQIAIQTLVDKLRPLVDVIADSPDPKVLDLVSPAPASSPRMESPGYRSSSPYVSAAEHVSDTSSERQRMSLGPSGSAMLDARSRSQRQERMRSGPRKQKPKSTDRTTSATGSDESNGKLESYFQAAMARFLKEQQATYSSGRRQRWIAGRGDGIRPEEWFTPADGEVTTEIPEHDRDRSRPRVSEHRRSGDVVPDLLPGESKGYWKHHSPGKWFRQAKITGKINNEKSILLLDTGAEVSIVDTAFARKVGCYVDTSQSQECVGIGESVYMTEGRTRIKVTLAGSLVYFFDIWVGDPSGQEAILGMEFMVPAGIRLDLADGSICLPDEAKIQLSGRRQL